MLDPRGTGGSDRPSNHRAYAIDDYVNDVEELRRNLALEQMDLLGHSHGGMVAMAYAAAHPERVSNLLLISTLARFAEEQAGAMEAAMQARAQEPWYADARAALEAEQAGAFESDQELSALAVRELPFYFARYGPAEAAYVRRLGEERVNGDALGLFNREIFTSFDLRPLLPRITAPTLVLAGEDDFLTGPVCAREIANSISGARLRLLPRAGHFVFIEAPAAFRNEVIGFLTTSTF